jgi:transcriptional regulator with GAF, ATPase, and Fis domain
MTRESQIVTTFVRLASTMADDFDVIEFLHNLVERTVELLDCSEAGLLLEDAAGELRVMASSSERSDALELLQSQNSEGPCFESHRTGKAIFSQDIAAETARWPTFAPAAAASGFLSVHALPMRVQGRAIGTLNLFRDAGGRVDDRDVTVAQAMADIAAIALVQERAVREKHIVVEQLQVALRSRVVIEQAKGVLAERLQIGVEDAFAHMRAYARGHNQRLDLVATKVASGQLDAADLLAQTGGTVHQTP